MFAALIVAIGVSLTIGFSGGVKYMDDVVKNWNRAVKKVVVDKTKRKEALDIIKKVKEGLNKDRVDSVKVFAEYFNLESNYNATMKDYEGKIIKIEKIFVRNSERVIVSREKIKSKLTEDEWVQCGLYVNKKMAKLEEKTFKELTKSKKKQKKQHKKYKKRH